MRHLLWLSVLLLGTSWAVAQSNPGQETSANAGGQQTVQGCLSSNGGTYTLVAKDGKSFQLTGDTAKLSEHVGHEIKVTGTVSSASESGSASTSPSSTTGSAQPTIDVSSVKHVSKTCGGKSSSY